MEKVQNIGTKSVFTPFFYGMAKHWNLIYLEKCYVQNKF